MSTAAQLAANLANGIGDRDSENCPPAKGRTEMEKGIR
jgi:hypothetical protein